jgi:hypothetical protein
MIKINIKNQTFGTEESSLPLVREYVAICQKGRIYAPFSVSFKNRALLIPRSTTTEIPCTI